MAKTKTQQAEAVDVLTLDYQLAELPSSQHRSGLAGLVMVVQWLERQPVFKQKIEEGAICKLTRLDDKGATLELNQSGLAALFDEIYAASPDEKKEGKLRTDKKGNIISPLREDEEVEIDPKTNQPKINKKTGDVQKKKVYFYPVTIPKGSFLADPSYDQSSEGSDGKNGKWIKLWRDMVWNILRGVPATRKPFEIRAVGDSSEDVSVVWGQLIKSHEFTVDLPSTYFLGAQANNAENIPFKDRARFQFLLHFWLFAAQIYVPAVVNNEGKRDFVGYAIAIPDIANLKRFCSRLPKILKERSIEPFGPRGYRPRDCIVDLAVESALDMMKRLSDRLTQTAGEQATASTVFGIDVIHTEKQGNNVRLLSMNRLNPEEAMIDRYTQIRDNFRSPLFRRQCLLNLVNHSPWYSGFDALLCTLPYEQSIENGYFRQDVRKKIDSLIKEERQMSEAKTQDDIAPIVFQMVKTYVGRKLKSKYDLEWKSVWAPLKQEERNKMPDYRDYAEKKAKIAKSAFLDIRSRTEQGDFRKYFVETLCSVPQHISSDSYVKITQALYDQSAHDQVRTLTLLALSANS